MVANLPKLLADPEFVYSHKDGGTDVLIDAVSDIGSPTIVGLRDGRVRTITPQDQRGELSGRERILLAVAKDMGQGKPVYARNEKALAEAQAFGLRQVGANSEGAM